MKIRHVITLALLMNCLTLNAAPTVVVQVPRITASPLIDGRVTTAEWESASRLDIYVNAETGAAVQAPTQVYLAHDGNNLYIAFRCQEPQMDQLQATTADRDGALWNDDCVEIFLDVEGKRERFAHFIVNPIGAQYDAMGSDASWNGQWLALTGREQDAWTVEISIPVAQLGMRSIKPADLWLANFCRSRKTDSELSAWSPTGTSFASPNLFGTLIFDSFSLRAASEHDALLSALTRLTREAQDSPFVAPETLGEAERLAQMLQRQTETFGREWTREEYLESQSNYSDAREMVKRIEFAVMRKELADKPYLVWQTNPWESFEARLPLSAVGELLGNVRTELLGNDVADVAFMITNLAEETLEVRALFEWAQRMPSEYGSDAIQVYHPQFVCAPDGTMVSDALVPENEARSLTIPARETRQVWIRFRSNDLKPGTYRGRFSVVPLVLSQQVVTVDVEVIVHPVSLPQTQRENVFVWDYQGDAERMGLEQQYHQALADHGVNVFIIHALHDLPRNAIGYDGKFLESLDFSRLRRLVGLKSPGTFYLSMDIWEKQNVRSAFGQPYYTDLWQQALKEIMRQTLKELKALKVEPKDVVVSPVDESCDQRYIEIAKLWREIDPEVRLIANASTTDASAFREVDPYVDIWCPHTRTFGAPEYREFHSWIRASGKPIWAYWYSGGANEKARSPHEYRMKHWDAFAWDLQGHGYWSATQHYGDPWHRYLSQASYDPSLIYPGRTQAIVSRRWLAFHRGVLDYEKLSALASATSSAASAPQHIREEAWALLTHIRAECSAGRMQPQLAEECSSRVTQLLVSLASQ